MFTALQALVLPASIVRALSPATAEVWAGALAPLHEAGPAWAALSLDPTATRVQFLRGIVYLASFLVALRIAERRGGTRFLSLAIIATALVLAMAAILHPLLGAERVFGVYKPVDMLDRHIAPLLNSNHLAAYLNIGFCLALGMALDRHADRYRPLAIAVAVVLAATQLWVASRGGAVAMVFGSVCVFVMARASRRFAIRTSASIILPAIVVAAGLAMIVLGAAPEAVAELNSADVSKVRIALSALPLAARYPFFGVGRGAFEMAFPSVRPLVEGFGYVSFSHPENIVVQWVTEWGIPVALLAFLALGAALRPKVLVVSSSPAIGAWSAIATTALHNLVDFNSEVPAIGIAIATCAAMVVAGRGNERRGWVHAWSAHPRGVATALGVATVASISVALIGWPHEFREDRAALYAEATRPAPREDLLEVERQAMLRHPAEAYFPFIGSVEASRQGKNVIPWIERTLTLSPIYGPAHFVLAEQLERKAPAQARLEYRLTLTQDQELPLFQQVIARATPLVRSFDDALEVVPANAFRLPTLTALAQSLGDRLPATRARLDEMIRAIDPNASGPLERAIADATVDLEAGDAAPWCTPRTECVQTGLEAVRHLAALRPGSCGPYVERARLVVAADHAPTALHELQDEAQTALDPPICWRYLGELAAATKQDHYVAVAEEAMARRAGGSDAECADHLSWAASLEERRGNYRSAMSFYARAQEKEPTRLDLVEHTAQLGLRPRVSRRSVRGVSEARPPQPGRRASGGSSPIARRCSWCGIAPPAPLNTEPGVRTQPSRSFSREIAWRELTRKTGVARRGASGIEPGGATLGTRATKDGATKDGE